MKMMYAGLSTSLNAFPERWRYNCTLNVKCQKKWYIPINLISDIDLYFELPFMPQSYSLNLIDLCSSSTYPLTPLRYVIGKHPRGHYGVFSNMSATQLPSLFYIRGEFVKDGQTAVFFSNDFTTEDCYYLTRVEGCYNHATIGAEAYDANDVYYGFPTDNVNYLGTFGWRYYHSVYVRQAKVTNNKHKLTLNLFNKQRVFKTVTSKMYNFQSEGVPEFYKDEIFAVLARGNILIDDKPYLVSELDLTVHSEESELWLMDVPLIKEVNTVFSCKETACYEIVPEATVPCCDPSPGTGTVEISTEIVS